MRGGPGSDAGIADTRFALAIFAAAAINAAALVAILVHQRRRTTVLVGIVQALDAVVAVALASLTERSWLVITVLAVSTLFLLYAYERSRTYPDSGTVP
jgi:ABC-type thiamin/hydroxymethylpyrimidine transport system permease subunit